MFYVSGGAMNCATSAINYERSAKKFEILQMGLKSPFLGICMLTLCQQP